MSLREELPFRGEYAKSGRSLCKSCKTAIEDKSLRMAVMVQSPFFDGKQANWHHYHCFFGRYRPKSSADIAHFAQLRYEDQKRIEQSIANPSSSSNPSGVTTKGKRKKGANSEADSKYADFAVEYSKSNRSKCRLCEATITKDDIRIGKMDRESESALRFGPQNRWFHVECFASARLELQFYGSALSIPEFNTLENNDQTMLKKKIPEIEDPNKNAAEDVANGTNGESPTKKPKKEKSAEDKALKKQSDLLYKYQDSLETLKKPQIIKLLDHNNISVADSVTSRLERLADSMAFGIADKCPECKGELVFRISGYICTGMATEWAKCEYQTDKPNRVAFKVPKDLAEEYEFLKKYKYVKRDRLYVPALKEAIASSSASNSIASTSTQNVINPKTESNLPEKALSGHKIFCAGKLKTARNQLKARIEKLGANLVKTIDRTVLCVITTEAEIKKDKLNQAKEYGIHAVSENFLDAMENNTNIIQAITMNRIADWGEDVERRVCNLNVKEKMKTALKSGSSSGSRFDETPSVQKMVIKGGNVVDPDSELQDEAHILKDGKNVYNAILNKVDLTSNKNSYYKLQLLEHDTKKNRFWVFRGWGRLGTTIGGTKLDKFRSKSEAIKSFEEVYYERTQNYWEDRKKFVKHPNCFYPVDVDYGVSDQMTQLKPGQNSLLPQAVQDLICMIFDVQKMKEAMLEFELDLEKMPLGKLSKKQLLNACSVLKEASVLIETKPPNKTKLVDATNRFYTLIPHVFGTNRIPLIDSEDIIKAKMEMLESLLDMEIAYELMTITESSDNKDPVDLHYEKLNTTIEPLDKNSESFKIIETYMMNTHASTHNLKLDIVEVYRVERHGEIERYKKFKDLDNRMLLWHGSRATNFAGILSQGLRIAPPEAPVTGYMFGKGIYFADMVTKSANYCHANRNNNIGLLLLSEVAVGVPHELTQAKDVKKPPKNKHSVKGCGQTEPDPNDVFVTEDGVKIPYGIPIQSKEKKPLLYNEYIVYDVDQVNIKYLLMVKIKGC